MQTSTQTDLSFKISGVIRGNDGVRPNANAARRRADREEIADALADDQREVEAFLYDLKMEGEGLAYEWQEDDYCPVYLDEWDIWGEYQREA